MQPSETTYIYTLSDPKTGEVRYVGKTRQDQFKIRKRSHNNLKINKNKKGHVCTWIVSLLENQLNPIIEIIDEIPTVEWEFWEIHYISLFKSWGFNLTNHTKGGQGSHGHHWSEESKKLQSIRLKGRSNHMKGRKLSEETKKKISEAGKKRGCKHLLNYVGCTSKSVLQVCVKTKEIINKFNSMKEASSFIGSNVRNSINKENRLTKGYKWITEEFYNKLENKNDIFLYEKPRSWLLNKISPFKGIPRSKEVIEKILKTKRENPKPNSMTEKGKEILKNAAIKTHGKSVVYLQEEKVIKEFSSVGICASELGISYHSVRKSCNTKKNFYGFDLRWKKDIVLKT